jgi:hypothetical protein
MGFQGFKIRQNECESSTPPILPTLLRPSFQPPTKEREELRSIPTLAEFARDTYSPPSVCRSRSSSALDAGFFLPVIIIHATHHDHCR